STISLVRVQASVFRARTFRFSSMTQTVIDFLRRSTPMKFIAGLRVWVNGVMGKTSQVFPRFSGSANRRVDLHLPLIASILGRRHGALESLADRRRRGAKSAESLLFSTKR